MINKANEDAEKIIVKKEEEPDESEYLSDYDIFD